MTTPLTWDRWKQLLLPHGWYIYDGAIHSPVSLDGNVQIAIWVFPTDRPELVRCFIGVRSKYVLIPTPSTPYQMMSLLHGLGIPLRSNPVHPPNPHSGKPVESVEQVSNQADTRK